MYNKAKANLMINFMEANFIDEKGKSFWEKLEDFLFYEKNYDEKKELKGLAFIIFSMCLRITGKKITVPDLFDPLTLMRGIAILDYRYHYETLEELLKSGQVKFRNAEKISPLSDKKEIMEGFLHLMMEEIVEAIEDLPNI